VSHLKLEKEEKQANPDISHDIDEGSEPFAEEMEDDGKLDEER